MNKNEILAHEFCEAIKKLAENQERLDNLESYLSYHFPAWLGKFANTPEGLTDELERFANMD